MPTTTHLLINYKQATSLVGRCIISPLKNLTVSHKPLTISGKPLFKKELALGLTFLPFALKNPAFSLKKLALAIKELALGLKENTFRRGAVNGGAKVDFIYRKIPPK